MNRATVEPAQVAVNAIVVVTTAALLYQPGPLVAEAGHDAWLAVLMATALSAAFTWGVWAAYFRWERAPGEPPGGGRPSWTGRLLALAFAAYAVYLGVLLIAQVATVFTTVLPEMPIAAFAAGTALTGWVLSAYGREALYRTGQFLFPLMVLASVANLVVSLAGNVDAQELLPVLEAGPGPVLRTVPLVFAFGSEVLVLAATAGSVRAPRRLASSLPLAVTLSGLLMAAYTAAAVGVLGSHEVARSTFPVLALARQVRVSLFLLRVEILTLVAWLTGTFVKEGLLLAAAGESVTRALGLGTRWQPAMAGVAAAATALLGVAGFSNSFALLHHVDRIFPVVAGAAAALFLLAGLLSTRGRPRHGRHPAAGNGDRLNGTRRAVTIGVPLLAVALLAPGCYGRVEPEQAAVVTVLGLDRGPQGGVRLTVEVVGAPAGAPMQDSGAISHQLLRAQGPSLLEAQRRLEIQAAREVLWSHINVVVVGRELAGDGLGPVLDALTRRYTFRRNAFLFVARDEAGDLLDSLAPAFSAPRFTAFQRAILRPSGRRSQPTDLNAFLRTLGHAGEDPYVPVVETAPPDAEPILRRVALFRRDRAVAVLDEPATRGLYWLTGQQQVERLLWPCPERRSHRGLGVTAVRSKATRRAGMGNHGPWAAAAIQVEADIEEWQCTSRLSPTTLAAAERLAAAAVEGEVRAALAETRALGVDPAGFGVALRQADPAAWAAIRDGWHERLRRLPVDVRVEVRLRRTGLTLDPP
ncbi:Ger(x)C family spore germination protein [Hydrogenibacillus sp. N12]|uniref:Ger(x)C family spore germination protein n=1 Tax=Hydrogenibacillus sp. N12 TaxID=2866627 RepID=UPI001C7E066B|nr:Ger(x)C family spore germination protein [Hydrogenibacillus sp. N12]QZA32161.1 Ger(x)C family spore germination protein [Hydrogenibacillus sp. N12]